MIGSMFALFIIISTVGNYYSLNRIKNKTVGQGQYGTARWANKKEIKRTYKHINFQPNKWRKNSKSRPTQQGIVVGCKNRTIGRLINLANKVFYSFRKFRNLFRKKKNKKVIALKKPVSTTTAMVDTGDVHALMIGAAGVGKTAYWLYPCIEYACATGMSFLCSDTKGDIVRNYGTIAEKYYGYKISVIDLRNPTRSHGNNLLHLVNKYMDLYKAEPEQLVYKARAEKYAKIISKTIILSGMDSASFGQNAYFYDAAEGLLTATILLVSEFCEPEERHIVSVFKIIQELLAPTNKKGKNQFQLLMDYLPDDHKAKWFAGAALNTAEQSMSSVMSTALSRLNAFLDSELEQLLCFDTEIDAEKFCNEKCAIFIVMPEENPNTFFMVSLIIQQLYREILSVADENGGVLKNRCIFFCDEFGTLPKIDSAEMMFSASRSRRLQIVPIIQSFAQLEKNYGKEGADVIIDNTQLTIFGGFAPNSTSAEVLSKALGSRTVMSGSVSRSKDNSSQSIQMIERPLMTSDELKSLPKGTFVVMKTGFYPMKVKLKLFYKWGIEFEEKYEVMENGNRKVHYANHSELIGEIIKAYQPQYLEEPATDSDFDEVNGEKKKNENLKTSPNTEQTESEEIAEEQDTSAEQPNEPTKQKYEPYEQPKKESKKKNAALKTEPPKGCA